MVSLPESLGSKVLAFLDLFCLYLPRVVCVCLFYIIFRYHWVWYGLTCMWVWRQGGQGCRHRCVVSFFFTSWLLVANARGERERERDRPLGMIDREMSAGGSENDKLT